MQRLACMFAILVVSSAAVAGGDGFRPIFDGKSLEGWDGNPKFWRVEDGLIVGQTTAANPTKGNTFLIWRGGKPADFELKAEFRMPDAGFANSGIQFRSREEPKRWGPWVLGGYQADLTDNQQYAGLLYEERGRGIIVPRGQKVEIGADHKPKVVGSVGDPAELLKKVSAHDWNEYHIIAQGNHIRQYINGHLMIELIDNDPKFRRLDGLIGLQLHAGPPMKVEFRNVRLKDLPAGQQPLKTETERKKIVFVAGPPSHGYAEHEHYAGCVLLANALKEGLKNVDTVVHKNGWPKEPEAFDDADAIVVFSSGAKHQILLPHMEQVAKLMQRGVGLTCLHWAVEAPKGPQGDQLKDWIGGYFETFWSVNPFWTAEFKQFPDHPICRGVKPFSISDEWYYHMRFVADQDSVTPILSAIPPESTRQGKDGPHSGNPTVRSRQGVPEVVAWARVRPDGGRGFGFTGGHYHWNFANDSFRTVVLNGIAWTAKLEIPAGGVPSKKPTIEELEANQDKPQPNKFDRAKVLKLMSEWK